MSSRDELKIFWPSHIHSLPGAQKSTGYMIGWFNSPNTVCIAAVIEEINVGKRASTKKLEKGNVLNFLYAPGMNSIKI